MPIDSQAIFKYITQGVYVISVNNGKQQNAFTAAWVMQVSFQPLLLCFSINPQHHSYKILQQGGMCCISVLDKKQFAVAAHFGCATETDKMLEYQWHKTKAGASALAESLAFFDCRVDHYSEAGDHKLVLCNVVETVILQSGEPMLYSATGDIDNSSELYTKS